MVVVALLIAATALGGVVSWPVLLALVFIVASVLIIRLAFKESKKPKLFAFDRRRPVLPVETDQDVRNKVLRQVVC